MRVIIGTDGSTLATRAAQRAMHVIAPGAEYVLASVYEPVESDATGFAGPTMSPEEIEDIERERAMEAETAATKTAAALGLVGVEHAVLPGLPGPALCHLAEERDADLVVVGTHGIGGVKRAVIGSVSDHVVRHAPCPVLVVGPEALDGG